MSEMIAKSFEVKFCERVTIRVTKSEWKKLEAVARYRGQTLERLIQDAEHTRPDHIQRPEWLRQVIKTRGQCCKYYVYKNGKAPMSKIKISLPPHSTTPTSFTSKQVMSHLIDNATWHCEPVQMREVNSNEAAEFILDSKLIHASPHATMNGVGDGIYVVLNSKTKEVYLCLYNQSARSYIFNLTSIPNNLTEIMECEILDFEQDVYGTISMKEKPFPSVRQQLGL